MASETTEAEFERARKRLEAGAAELRDLGLRKRQQTIISWIATFAAGIGTVLSITLLFAQNGDRLSPLPSAPGVTQQELREHQRRIERMEAAVQDALRNPPVGTDAQPRSVEVAALAKRLDAVEAEQKRLSAIITASPEKAVAIPMMRRDIDDMKDSHTQTAEALRREIDRIFDLNKWIIGGLSVGVLGLLVRDIFRPRGQPG